YIEASKGRLYNSGNGGNSAALMAQAVLLYTFENILKVLHPFMPFVTEELWQALPNRKHDLIVSPWPETQLPRLELSEILGQNIPLSLQSEYQLPWLQAMKLLNILL
ncbi:valine--tRNA ligase-like, partial [Trifolium medium]|nr:valine--tRNA ligase-like [Trifolium medium]